MRSFSESIQILAGAGVDVSRVHSPSYASRLAGNVERQRTAGLAPNVQAARGHATTEKGKAVHVAPAYKEVRARPAPTTAQERAKVYRGGKARGQLVSGGSQRGKEQTKVIDVATWGGKTDGRAERVIAALAQSDPSAQVRIVWRGSDGAWHEMYRHGRAAGAIAKDIASAGGFGNFLSQQVEKQYGDEETTAESEAYQEWMIIAA